MSMSAILIEVAVLVFSASEATTPLSATVGASFTSVSVSVCETVSSGFTPTPGSSTWTVTS